MAACAIQACSSTRSTTSGSDTTGTTTPPATGTTTPPSIGTTAPPAGTTIPPATSNATPPAGSTNSMTGMGTAAAGSNVQTSTSMSEDTGTGVPAAAPGSTQTSPMDAQMFIQQAALSGMKEVQLGKIAQQKAQNPGVKEYGAMMVKDHNKANSELMGIAKNKNITLPQSASSANSSTTSSGSTAGSGAATSATTASSAGTGGSSLPGTMSQEDINASAQKLNQLNGTAFDQTYTQMMIEDHKKAIALFEQGSRSSDPAVKAYATKHLPTLRNHLTQVTNLNSKVGNSSGANN